MSSVNQERAYLQEFRSHVTSYLLLLFLIPSPLCVWGCTNIIVTPSASVEGTVLLGYNDDSSKRHGLVTHFPAANYADGDMRSVYDYDTGALLGEIPQPEHTFNVMANSNEMGVVIGETTHGGLVELTTKNGTIMDYGSLIYTTLQRATSARHAIETIVDLTSKYGYASSAEGFSITDGKEAWLMELIGKGEYGTGIVWVALRVPDGYITAHANQGRITTFLPCDDPTICMMAPDVVTFAIDRGYFDGPADDLAFSFSDTYDPVTVSGARFCEARVWYIFSQVANPSDFNPDEFLSYAQGFNLTNRMPLFVRPKKELSRERLHALLSSHFEESWFDPSHSVGGGAEHSPYRWNGLTWTINGDNATYVNERVIGTQYQAWHFVAEVRGPDTPGPIRALSWWGSDEHAWAPKVPLYGGATTVHRSYDDGNCSARLQCRKELGLPGSMLEFSWDSAYWVNSAVAKLVYGGKDSSEVLVGCAQQDFNDWVAPLVARTNSDAAECFAAHASDEDDWTTCVGMLDELAVTATREASARWTSLWQTLMVTHADGFTATSDSSNLLCGCRKDALAFTDEWKTIVVENADDERYRLPGSDCAYIDPDGHCQPAASWVDVGSHEPKNSKYDVPGVAY